MGLEKPVVGRFTKWRTHMDHPLTARTMRDAVADALDGAAQRLRSLGSEPEAPLS